MLRNSTVPTRTTAAPCRLAPSVGGETRSSRPSRRTRQPPSGLTAQSLTRRRRSRLSLRREWWDGSRGVPSRLSRQVPVIDSRRDLVRLLRPDVEQIVPVRTGAWGSPCGRPDRRCPAWRQGAGPDSGRGGERDAGCDVRRAVATAHPRHRHVGVGRPRPPGRDSRYVRRGLRRCRHRPLWVLQPLLGQSLGQGGSVAPAAGRSARPSHSGARLLTRIASRRSVQHVPGTSAPRPERSLRLRPRHRVRRARCRSCWPATRTDGRNRLLPAGFVCAADRRGSYGPVANGAGHMDLVVAGSRWRTLVR